MERTAPSQLLLISAGALVAFGYTSWLVARRRTAEVDGQAREELQAARAAASDAAAKASGPLGKEYLHVPAAVGLTWFLRRRGLGRRASVPLAASVASELLNRLVTRTLHIRVVPPGHPAHRQQKPSFPSGHAMETTGVALTAAYVLARERILHPGVAFAAAGALAAASALGRLLLDRHWVSDAIGGVLLGGAVAAASGAAYETLPS
jgi:undecaprenyl-diphosphatase